MRFKICAGLALLLALTACAGNQKPEKAAVVDSAPAVDVPDPHDQTPTAAITTQPIAPGYYIEFRSRPSVLLGHTYIAYGPLNDKGEAADEIIMGFWPKGGLAGMLAGTVAMPGRIARAYWDEKLPDTNRFRVTISPAQYESLVRYVEQEQQTTHYWNMFMNNCNDFAAGAAKAIGLKVPGARFIPSGVFVLTLSSLNS